MRLTMALTLDGLVRALRRAAHDVADAGPERSRSGAIGKATPERGAARRTARGDVS